MVYMPHWPKPVGLLQNETSLERMQAILEKLGNPHRKLPKVIHVAGTNGKGSTVAFLQAILEAAGSVVHTYTTPHLIEFNERIVLAGEKISDDFLFEVMEEVRINSEGLRLGFFESTTAGAFLAFSKVAADYLILETGMGGRLDATNIVENPAITILTTIDLDHKEFLGVTPKLIAGEKVHIVKKGSVCISSLQHDEVNEVIENWCALREIKHLAFGADFWVEKGEGGFKFARHCEDAQPPKQSPEIATVASLLRNDEFILPNPSLVGDHQYINASNAIAAALELGISKEHISTGLQNTYHPSRMEKIERDYVPQNWELWLDGAHNPSGAFAISNYIADNWGDKPAYLIFCTTRGREIKDFLKYFLGKIEHLCLVKINFEPNSYDAEEMLPAAQELGFDVSTHDNLQEAIKFLHTTKKQPARILACGSLFMRGDL